jgi:Zn finger protein HypA/HybF involved in hydrogenase expression
MRCTYCRKDILPTQEAQRLPPPELVLVGPKSGLVGLYPHPQYQGEEEAVIHHPHCCMPWFDPGDNPRIFDRLQDELREKIVKDVQDEIREEFQDRIERVWVMIGEGNLNFCGHCLEELEEEPEGPEFEEPPGEPDCLFCKSNTYVWEKTTPEGVIYHCGQCRKYWNEEEEELAAAA